MRGYGLESRMLWGTRWAYRLLTCLGFGAAAILALAFPYRMHRPDPWAYYYAVRNFARAEFVVSDARHAYQSLEAKALGGHLDQYVRLEEDRWALEKAPGFPLFVVPFYWLGLPRAANVVLGLAATGVIYLFLRRLLDEGAAYLGAILFLFTPANLVVLHQGYMDTFASGAFPAVGGGLYFYYMLRRDGLSPQASPLLLFPAGLFLSWAVVCRSINLYIALLVALHLALTSLSRTQAAPVGFVIQQPGDGLQIRHEQKRGLSLAGLFRDPALAWRELVSFGLGCGLSLVVLLAYNNHVFGAPLDYGYQHSHYTVRFVYGQLLSADPAGREEARQAIATSLGGLPQPLFIGFPLLGAALPALVYARRRIPLALYGISVGWLLVVFVPYVGFIWIARLVLVPINTTWRFFVITRYFVPWLFPLTVLAVVSLHSTLRKWGLALAVVYGLVGTGLYLRALAVG